VQPGETTLVELRLLAVVSTERSRDELGRVFRQGLPSTVSLGRLGQLTMALVQLIKRGMIDVRVNPEDPLDPSFEVTEAGTVEFASASEKVRKLASVGLGLGEDA
jgi:hypothetical protein